MQGSIARHDDIGTPLVAVSSQRCVALIQANKAARENYSGLFHGHGVCTTVNYSDMGAEIREFLSTAL